MPGFTEDALAWRKRKRENEDSIPRQTPFVPFLDHSTCDPYIPRHHDLEDRDRGDKELHWSSRPRCLPRKRRLLHAHNHNHPHQQHQPQYLLSTTPHTQSLLSPNIYSNTRALDPYSPPVSPKTLIPLSCPTSTPTSAGAGTATATPSALRPCHICHRRPTTRALLDAYADCDLCAERACYICLRLCDGESCPGAAASTNTANSGPPDPYAYGEDENTSSRRKICSSCAVEGIADGVEIVRCLDCVRPWWGLDGDQMVEGN